MTSYITRDNVCQALSDLFGYNPQRFDGLTLAELWQQLQWSELNQVCDYLGIA